MINKRIYLVLGLVSLLVFTVITSGCEQFNKITKSASDSSGQPGENYELTSAERKLRELAQTSNDTFQNEVLANIDKTILEAELASVGLVSIASLIRGDDMEKIFKNAGKIGIPLGLLGGALMASYQAQTGKKGAAEDKINDNLLRENQQDKKFNSTAQEVLAENQQKLSNLKARAERDSKAREQYDKKLKLVAANRQVVISKIQDKEKQLDFYNGAIEKQEKDPATNKAKLRQIRKQFERNKSEVETMKNISEKFNAVGRG